MNENNEREVVNVDVDDVVDKPSVSQRIKSGAKRHKIILFLSQFSFLFTVLLYVILSLTVKGPIGPYQLNGWGFWWIVFLIAPIMPQLYQVLKKRNLNYLPIDWLVVISYLLIGILTKLWHPYWFLLLITPVFHVLVAAISPKRKE